MLNADSKRHRCQTSDTYTFERLADELIFKGALLLGAGLGLYVAIRFFGSNPKDPKSSIHPT
ncbi:MAG: hypothetical protein L0H53_12410 [Candidatus Nitrosocosmicus sp.]|nr:hypothetical protein [Candidatus Nitrosocosmicus sp.]